MDGTVPAPEHWMILGGWAAGLTLFGLLFFWQGEETYGDRTALRARRLNDGSRLDESPLTVVAHNLRVRYKVAVPTASPAKALVEQVPPKADGLRCGTARGLLRRSLRRVHRSHRAERFGQVDAAPGSRRPRAAELRHRPDKREPDAARSQCAALIPDLTGAQNVKLGALAMGLTPQQADDVFEEVVELSALGDAIDLPMRTYSSGMGARLKFAISLAADPSILMIDEALATGDATFAERSQRAMDEMLAKAGTVFLVNHAAQTIENMCSRAIWMERGQVVLDGDAVEVARQVPVVRPQPRPGRRGESGRISP